MPLPPEDRATSFNRPALVRYDSLRDSKDLGPITDIKAVISGYIGAEAGSQSLFFSFDLRVPATIQITTETGNRWTSRFVSVALRSEKQSIALDELGNAFGTDIANTIGTDESIAKFPPGKYTVIVSCSQWQSTPFALLLRVNPTTRLYTSLRGRGGLGTITRLRIATARLEGSLDGRGSLGSPGAGLFSGRRDKPLGIAPLTGRGKIDITLSIRETLGSIGGCFLTGRGRLRSVLTSNGLGPRLWASKLNTLVQTGSNNYNTVSYTCLAPDDYSYQVFYLCLATFPVSQRRLAFVYRSPTGEVLWSRVTDIFVDSDDANFGDFLGWGLIPLPDGDVIAYRRTTSATGNFPQDAGIYVMRINKTGSIDWKKVYVLRISVSDPFNDVVDISSVQEAKLINDRVHFTYTHGLNPGYLRIDPADGEIKKARYLANGTLTNGGQFGSSMRVCLPIKAYGDTLYLVGAKQTFTPGYTWIAVVDDGMDNVYHFYKYGNGANTVYNGNAVIHDDGVVSIVNTAGALLQLNPDLTIRRITAGFSVSDSTPGLEVDAAGTLYWVGSSNALLALDKEGNITYQRTSISLPARIDQFNLKAPASNWMDPDSDWAVMSTSVPASNALGCVVAGFEIKMPSNTVTGDNFSVTIGGLPEIGNALTIGNNNQLQREDEIGGTVVSPVSFFTPGVASAVDPVWDPTLINGASYMSWSLFSSTIKRGLSTAYPSFRAKEPPIKEPDPYKQYVTFLLPGSGPIATTFFTDYSNYGNLPASIQGQVQFSTEQAKFPDISGYFPTTSIKFDGSGDAIAYANAQAFRLGFDDFTVEAWVYPLGLNQILFDNSPLGDPAAHNNSFMLYINWQGFLYIYSNGATRLGWTVTPQVVPLNTWNHIAICREEEIWRIYLNGQVQGSGWRQPVNLSAGGFIIGAPCTTTLVSAGQGAGALAPVGNFNGYMQDIRITNGVSRYHRNFQPRNAPIQYSSFGPPFSLPAGTEPAESGPPSIDYNFDATLLFARMNGSGINFVDSGPYDITLIPAGNAQQLSGGKWGGNQGYFDGIGDYLDLASNTTTSLGSGDFTIELWAQRLGNGSSETYIQSLLDSRTALIDPQVQLRITNAAQGWRLCLYLNGAIRIYGEPMVAATRYHIALVRSAGVITLYMNGSPVGGSSLVDSTNFTATNWSIARSRISEGADSGYFHGHMNDVRILRRALYLTSFTPPAAPLLGPPVATARYWRMVNLRTSSTDGSGQFALSELGLYQGRLRLPNTLASSSPAPSSGLLTSTQDQSVTVNCNWNRSTMEQVTAWIQLDAGEQVTADSIRMAVVSAGSFGIKGFDLLYSDDAITWTKLGVARNYPLPEATLAPRIPLLPLPTSQEDADFDRVVLYLRGNDPGASVLDSGPRQIAVTSSNLTKTTQQSVQGGQSLWFNAGSNAYLTLGEPGGRSTFFTFGTGTKGDFTVEMSVFPLTVPPTQGCLFCTNAIGDNANYTNGFMFVLTSQMRLNVYINGQFQGATATSIPVGQWSHVRLTRNILGIWRYAINDSIDAVSFVNNVTLSNRAFTMGRDGANAGDLKWFNGYMDDIRVTQGLARGDVLVARDLGWFGTARGDLGASSGPTLSAAPPEVAVVLTSMLTGEGDMPSTLQSQAVFSPASLSPLVWWDFSDGATVTTNDGLITQITDKSGNARTLTQATPSNRPTYQAAAMNGLAAARWPGSNNTIQMVTAAFTLTATEIYVVGDFGASQGTNYEGLVSPASGSDGWMVLNPGAAGAWFTGWSAVPTYLNGDDVTDRKSTLFPDLASPFCLRAARPANSFSSTVGIRLGADRDNFGFGRGWKGDICEVLIFQSALSTGDRANLVAYLQDKWGTPT
jgi:hypothetical protein